MIQNYEEREKSGAPTVAGVPPIVYGSFKYECAKYGAAYLPQSLHERDCIVHGLNPFTTTVSELERAQRASKDCFNRTISPEELTWLQEKLNSAYQPLLEDICHAQGLNPTKIRSGWELECARAGLDPLNTTVDDLKEAGSLVYNN